MAITTNIYYDAGWTWDKGNPFSVTATEIDWTSTANQGGYKNNPAAESADWTFYWKALYRGDSNYIGALSFSTTSGTNDLRFYSNWSYLQLASTSDSQLVTSNCPAYAFPFWYDSWHKAVKSGTTVYWYVYSDATRTTLNRTLTITVNATRKYPYLLANSIGNNSKWILKDSSITYEITVPNATASVIAPTVVVTSKEVFPVVVNATAAVVAPTVVMTSKRVIIANPISVSTWAFGPDLVPRNLLKFTENDPSNFMTVTETTSTLTVPNSNNSKSRLYQDNGANVFVDFTFKCDVNVQQMVNPFKYVLPLGFSSGADPGTNDWSGIGFFPYANGSLTHGWYISAGTSPYNSGGRPEGTPEYFTFTKVAQTVTLYRYSDSGRTNLTFSLTTTDTAGATYRYLFVNRDMNWYYQGGYTGTVSNVLGTDTGYFKVLIANPKTVTIANPVNATAASPTQVASTPTYYDSDWVWNNGTPQAITHTSVDFRKNAVQGGYRRNPTNGINWTFKWKEFLGKTAGADTRIGVAEAIPVYTPPSWWIPFGILTRIYYGNNGSNGFYFDSLYSNGTAEATASQLGISSGAFPFDMNSWHSLVRNGSNITWYIYANESRTDLRYTLSMTINATRLYPYLYHLAVGPNTNMVAYDSSVESAQTYSRVSQVPSVVNVIPTTVSPTVDIITDDTDVTPSVVLANVNTNASTIDIVFRAVFPHA